jgi:hypothetical protein
MTINKDLHNQVSVGVGVAIALTAVADGEDVVGDGSGHDQSARGRRN